MATKLGIYQGALHILKEPAYGVTVTDDVTAINVFSLEYPKALKYMLEAGKWNHAARSLAIEASEDVEPAFGYSFAFAKPSDYRNLIKISGSATFYPPFGPNEYVDEGAYWYANVDPLFVSIVSDGASWGGDLSLWPEIFARAVEYDLALRGGPHIASMSEQAMDLLEKRRERALKAAKAWDASKQPPEDPPPPRLSMARLGRYGRRDSWR